MRLSNVQNIFIGDDVMINHHAFLLTRRMESGKSPRLVIDSGAVLGHFSHITCVDSVHIGKKVLIADKVHISDNSHVFADPNIPIMDQSFFSKSGVSIGDGTWIGENASIQSCRIGKHCVVGSNSVVIRDIPDYTVVAGAPARVLRRLDPETGLWNRVTGA
jgi:acetyltransferase-like isoleucine patch superfamily enzyme